MLNEQERSQAAACGWLVCEVFDLSTERLVIQVLPGPNNPVRNAEDLLKVVMARATAGDALAQRITQIVVSSFDPPKKRKKK